MGLMAVYMGVSDATLALIAESDDDDLIEQIEELSDTDEAFLCDIDKNWDMLHFVLTGASAVHPITDDPLSEAIVGVHVYNTESYVAATKSTKLPRIVEALSKVNIDTRRDRYNLEQFRKHGIYPSISVSTPAEEESLWQTLKTEFQNLVDFYQKTTYLGLNVIVSIY